MLPPTVGELDRLAKQARGAKLECDVDPRAPVARSLRRRLTPEVRQAIVARYEAGESAKALSQEFDISRDGARRLLKNAGVAIRPQFVVTPQAASQIVQLYESGLTIRQVAAQVRCAYGTVRGVLQQSGVEVRVSPVGKQAASER